MRVGARPGRPSHRITPEPWPLLVFSADGVRPPTGSPLGLEQLSPSRRRRIPWPLQPTPTAQHSRLGMHPGHVTWWEGCGPFTTAVLSCGGLLSRAVFSPPHRHIVALSFPRPALSEVRLETGSGRLLWLQVILLLILEQELLLLFKALNIHTGWRGSGLLPSPPPRNRELGAQALPGIGHGPPWQSWVTGKCPSSAGLQAAQTMLGCPGLWPPKTKRGWETALRDPFIPGAGPAAQPWPCAGCPGLRPLGLPDAW